MLTEEQGYWSAHGLVKKKRNHRSLLTHDLSLPFLKTLKAQWMLHTPPGLINTSKFYILTHTVYLCVLYESQNTQRFFPLYTTNWLVFTTETECVYCAVRPESLYMIRVNFERLNSLQLSNKFVGRQFTALFKHGATKTYRSDAKIPAVLT
jgi:hypothetical protein